MMNKETRKLSKFPQEVRAELDPYFVDAPPDVKQDTRKWSKRDENIVDHVCNGLMVSLVFFYMRTMVYAFPA